MPSIIKKLLHRKSRSGSNSSSNLTSPSAPGLPGPNDTFETRRDRRTSLPASRQGLTSPSAPALARKSMDDRRRDTPTSPTQSSGLYNPDVNVSPVRPAPPPPNNGTIVIDPTNDPTNPAAHHRDASTGTSPDINSNGHVGSRDTPYQIPFNIPTAGFGSSMYPLPPGAATPDLSHVGSSDINRDLPPLPHTLSSSSHEIKEVEGRRTRPIMDHTGSRQSLEAEWGRQSNDAHRKSGEHEQRGSGLEAYQEEEGVGEYARKSGERRRRKQSLDVGEIPPRGASLAGSGTVTPTPGAAALSKAGHGEDGVLVSKLGGLTIGQGQRGVTGTLEEQQQAMVKECFEQAKANKEFGPLSEFGIQTFGKASMGELVGKKDTVEIKTRWLTPIIQETIIPRIHTEYTTIIDRHYHHYHVYPKIQPVEDPDPVQLPPLHRIFSPQTGKWHEVQGDEAAIAILGEDVFRNGPKEVRHKRTPFTLQMHLEEEAARNGGQVKPVLDSYTDGMTEEELLGAGFGTGGKGRVVEREGLLGEKLGDWRDAARGRFFGRGRDEHVGLAV